MAILNPARSSALGCRLVIVRPPRRSLDVVSRWIVLGGLCAASALSGCASQARRVTTSADAVTRASTVITTAGTATAAASGVPQTTSTGKIRSGGSGTEGEQTDPRIAPRSGGPRTVFIVRLWSRTRLGAHGVLDAVYRIRATGPSTAGCDPGATSTLDRGASGQRLTVVLRPGPTGWCRGDWRGLVLLETGPSCAGGSGAAKAPCPEFASRLAEVGRFGWRVR